MNNKEIEDQEDSDNTEVSGERYVDLGGIYALIIDDDNIEDCQEICH